jgi:hypothetical protein
MKRKSLLVAAISGILSLFLLGGVARAQAVRSAESVTVPKNQVINSMLFSTGTDIKIEGTINGDVFCFGQNITISGIVLGDIYCAGQNITFSGNASGSVRLASQNITFSGKTLGSVSLAAQTVKVENGTDIGRDLLIAADNTTVNGKIARDASIGAKNATVLGTIGRDLGGRYQFLTLAPSANVKGNIDYTSKNDLLKASSTKVGGEITRRNVTSGGQTQLPSIYVFAAYMFISLLIVSLTLVLLVPKMFAKTTKVISEQTGKTIWRGLFMLFIAPIVLIFVTATLVGIPLAGLGLAAWVLILSLSGPIFAYSVGHKVTKGKSSPFMTMLAGSVIVLALYLVPFINAILGLIVGVVGSGAAVGALRDHKLVSKKS